MTTWTAEDAVAELRKQHTPYLPEVVSIIDMDDPDPEWRDATVEDKAASLEWWCDGCNCPSSRCRAMPVLDLIGTEKP